jgi:DNA-binding GntR family transcriptional regulator
MPRKLAFSTRPSEPKEPEPLLALQLGSRVYQAILDRIVSGYFEFGVPLRPDAIARQFSVSTTPVREALHRLEIANLIVKRPNLGWSVRKFTHQQIRELYEFRANLERFSVRLACARRMEEDMTYLRHCQTGGERVLSKGDINGYRIYNRDLHAAICRSARNSYLSSVMDQLALQSEMLSSKTIRIAGRPMRALEEHSRLIEFIATGNAKAAEELMEHHIMSALDDILQFVKDDEEDEVGF